MVVDIKLTHPLSKLPTYAHKTDGAMDLTAVSVSYVDNKAIYDTGVAISIPPGYVGLLFPRSSIVKYNQRLANSVGVVDANFLNSIKVVFDFDDNCGTMYKVGDRIAQLMIIPRPEITLRQVEELGTSERNLGGFGSTGT